MRLVLAAMVHVRRCEIKIQNASARFRRPVVTDENHDRKRAFL